MPGFEFAVPCSSGFATAEVATAKCMPIAQGPGDLEGECAKGFSPAAECIGEQIMSIKQLLLRSHVEAIDSSRAPPYVSTWPRSLGVITM